MDNKMRIITIYFAILMFSISAANADPLKVAVLDTDPAIDLSAVETSPLKVAPVNIPPAFGLSALKTSPLKVAPVNIPPAIGLSAANIEPLSTICVDEKLASSIAAEKLDDGWIDVVYEWVDEVSEQVDIVSERINLSPAWVDVDPAWVDVDPAWVDVNPASSISDTSPFSYAWVDISPAPSISEDASLLSNTACVDVRYSIAAGVSESEILENLVSSGYDMDLDAAVQSILDASGNQQNTLIAALIVNPDYAFTPAFDPTAGFEPTAAGEPIKLPATPVVIAANDVSSGGGEGVSP
jgi:hypothetical protein